MSIKSQDYSTIKQAFKNRQEIEFDIEKSSTAFSDSTAPISWTAYPPAYLPLAGYLKVYLLSGNDSRGDLMRIELDVHLKGGKILYKDGGNDIVSLKITWPDNK